MSASEGTTQSNSEGSEPQVESPDEGEQSEDLGPSPVTIRVREIREMLKCLIVSWLSWL